ncbi:APC family permease [Dactylosporangium darangshiense]|uniref:APC family permease n=1 Tax=Dactylosporangium darangshiense TaxID=579108 RepID=A0ABP8DMY1_9ACTN
MIRRGERPVSGVSVGLARRRMNGAMLALYEIGASSPMTVLVGGVLAMYQTGVVGVPPTFLLAGLALGLLVVGYVAMSRHVPHAAPGYALPARGLGPRWGLVGAALALPSYSAIGIAILGLFGSTLSGLVGGSWVWWAVVGWAVIAVAGVLNVALNTWVVAVVLCAELGTIAAFILAAFTHPAGGEITFTPLSVGAMWRDGLGGVFTFAIAAFVGFETAPVFSEEAKHSRSVARSIAGVLAFYPLFLFMAAWAVAVGVGGLSEEVNDPASGLPFVVLDRAYGSGLSLLATMLLVTSMLTSMLAFHGTVARYVYGMAREKVLPGWLDLVGGTGARAGAPIAGSLTQSAVALIVLAVVAAVHADPVTFLFTWLSAGAALGVLVLLVLASVAAVVFFRAGRGGHESVWVRTVAPVLGVLAGGAVIVVMLANQSLLLHETKVGPQLVLPGLIVVAVVAGLVWAAQMRRSRPRVYAEIGHGRPDPIAQPEARLAVLDV